MSAGAQQAAPPFLQGSLETFPLGRIFAGLTLSRQLVRVRLSNQDNAVGVIVVKAGQVIDATDYRTQTSGTNALAALMRDPGTSFEVFRLTGTLRGTPRVIGRLAELVAGLQGGPGRVPQAARGAAGSGADEAGEKVRAGRLSSERPPAASVVDTQGDPGEPQDVPSAAFTARDRPEAPPPAEPKDAVEPERSEAGRESEAGIGGFIEPAREPMVPEGQDEVSGRGRSAVMLRGNVSDIGFAEILEVLELNPQRLLVSFLRAGEEVGTVDMMSQEVLGAAAAGLSGREAFEQLDADPGETFEVRSAGDATASVALGTVAQMLAAARAAREASPIQQVPPHSKRALFMEGQLAVVPMEPLIASLNLSRQPIELEFRRDEEVLHRVVVKAGQILSATSASGEDGVAALAAIREDPGNEFVVYRRRELASGVPLAPLRMLLLDEDGAEDATSPVPAAAPVPGPAVPATPVAPGEDRRLKEIEASIDADMAGLRDALEDLRRIPSETTRLSQALSRSVAETAELVTGLESTHKAALEELRELLVDLRQTDRDDRALLGFILALQFVCVAVVGTLLVLAIT